MALKIAPLSSYVGWCRARRLPIKRNRRKQTEKAPTDNSWGFSIVIGGATAP
ncbi:hypothetical protein IC611_23405 (plasmid) [Proteus mirabilis]